MRTDILPLCDKHYRAMEPSTAPLSADYAIEFFRCTAEFCRRCFSERLGYVAPKWGEPPNVSPNQPRLRLPQPAHVHFRPGPAAKLDSICLPRASLSRKTGTETI